MRLYFAVLALTVAGCSSGTGPSKRASSGPQSTPRPQAADLNLPGAPAAGPAGSGGTTGGPGGTGGPGQSAPGSSATPGPATLTGTNTNPARRPPIEPGLARMPGYQPSLAVVNAGTDVLARGYNLYQTNCAMCHGADLRGELSAPGMPMRDLTKFKEYKYGSTDQAIYRSIVYGIPKTAMGNAQTSLNPQQVWDLINYMKSKRTDGT